jgi:glutaminyl-peptide cyclotransferase
MRFVSIFFTVIVAFGCSGPPNASKSNAAASRTPQTPLPVYGYEIIKTYPHDGNAFTQGLFFHDGFLYESTGEKGESTVRKVELATGKVLQKWDLPPDEFGEGIALLGDKIYMVTWQDNVGRVFDLNDFKVLREFTYIGEGWGLTTDGTNLIMSQGTHVLKMLDPETLKQVKTVPVMREDGRPLMRLNELEFVKGEIWANIWHSEEPETLGKPNYIARIDPASGKLLGWINLDGISPDDLRRDRENVLNGIAYDAAGDRIFITGKKWRNLYEIKLKPPIQ